MTTSGRRLSPETRPYDDPFVGLLVADRREENEGGGRARAEAADPHGVSPAGFRERRQGNANGEACKRQRARQPGRALIHGRDHDVDTYPLPILLNTSPTSPLFRKRTKGSRVESCCHSYSVDSAICCAISQP